MKKLKLNIAASFMSMKMSKRLFVIFTILFLLALLSLSLVDQHIYKTDMRNTTLLLFEQYTTSFQETLDSVFQKMDSMTLTPLFSKKMQLEMKNGQPLSEASIDELYFASEMLNFRNKRNYFTSLYNIDGEMLYTTASIQKVKIARSYGPDWVSMAQVGNGVSMICALPEEEEDFACAAIRLIKETAEFENIGVMTITVADLVFEEIFASAKDGAPMVALALDSAGNVFFCSDPTVEEIPGELLKEINAQTDRGSTAVETPTYLGYYTREAQGKYAFLMYTDYESLLVNQHQSRVVMTVIYVLICLVTLVVIKYLAEGTTRPLSKMTSLMRQVQKGDYSVRFHVLYRDEIGVMATSFNAMMDKLDEMTKHLVRINVVKKQIEIDTLQKQINPHFLYNTLEKYRMMAVERDDYEMADQICMLGKLMRYNITAMNKLTTLAQELEFVEYYLSIQNSGNNRIIQLETQVPDDLLEYPIIKLLLQPIVENSIFHGLKAIARENAMILICCTQMEDFIEITVADNGVGMDEEKLKQVRRNLDMSYEEGGSAHIGLRNVHARIQLFYGERYGLWVDSVQGSGTQVRIQLPYKNTEG